MNTLPSTGYTAWRDAVGAAVAGHDVTKLREAGCVCTNVLRDFRGGVLCCGHCGVSSPSAYPKAQFSGASE